MGPVELLEGLDERKTGGDEAVFDLALKLGGGLDGEEPFEEFLVGDIVLGGLADDLRMVFQGGRETEVSEHLLQGGGRLMEWGSRRRSVMLFFHDEDFFCEGGSSMSLS
jgi:hypothetical protein